jgi:hypothetical protein
MFLVAANDCEAGALAVTSCLIAVGSFYFLFSVILYYPFLFIRIFYVEQLPKIYVFLLSFFFCLLLDLLLLSIRTKLLPKLKSKLTKTQREK